MSESAARLTGLYDRLSTYVPVAVLLAGVLLSFALAKGDYDQINSDAKALTNERLYRAKSQLEQALNERLNVSYALEAFVKINSHASLNDAAQFVFVNEEALFKSKFLQHADALSERTRGLMSIQLAPQAVVTYLTNEERNKAAIGHDLLMDPNRREQTLRTIQEHKLIVAGPVTLKQGGDAFIARLAIFTEANAFDPAAYMRQRGLSEKPDWLDEIPSNFWGLATVLIDVNVLYEEAQIDTLIESTMFALRGRHGLGESGEVFWGNESVFDHPTAAVPILLPAGEWIIAAVTPFRLDWLSFVNSLLTLFVALLLYKLVVIQRRHIQIQAASEIKSAILANISHEMRTPVNGIVGMSELLMADSAAAAQSEQLEAIRHSALHVADMINDVVDMAAVEIGQLQLSAEAFELGAELQSIGSYMAPHIASSETQLVCPVGQSEPLHVLADRRRLRQVLVKLIDNAIRFSSASRIEVEYSALRRTSDTARVRFSVRDNGMGIEREKQQFLLQAFTRNDMSGTGQHGGLGVGLSISQAIVGAMGGTLEISGDERTGSTFFFTLDLPIEATAERVDGSDSAQAIPKDISTSLRLALVVDDNSVNNLVMAAAMRSFGFEVEMATNGAQAVEKAEKSTYELILMDCQMPVMDGYEATKAIRQQQAKNDNGNRPPIIIACTANALEENRTKCLEVGMNDFLAKPVQRDEIAQVLRRHGLLA